MAKINVSKRMRKSTFIAQSDDESSQYGSLSNSGSYYDSDDDHEYQPQIKRNKTFANVESSTQRKPTRVPDPSVKNRNALLARENRQRKKMEMQNLEEKVAKLQEENRKLHKIMKSKDVKVAKMADEVKYLRSILNNSKEIVSVIKSINLSPPVQTVIAEPKTLNYESYASTGSETTETAASDDLGKLIESYNFVELLNDETFNLDIPNDHDGLNFEPFEALEDLQTPYNSYETPPSSTDYDHNYNQSSKNSSLLETPGVCVHINSGKVSLEFCSSCHKNASTKEWIESI
jgi:hypothetical protein